MTHPDSFSQTVYDYYIDRFSEMPFDKQFHFTSRLYLWSQDETAGLLVQQLRPDFTFRNEPAEALRSLYEKAQESPVHGSKNAAELRRQYFEKYPRLKTCLVLLFRVAFLRSVYGIDAREALDTLCSRDELQALFDDLTADHEAVAILSTHAINFMYLYSRFVLEDEALVDPTLFLDIAHKTYDSDNKMHLQLMIYLYTHCIIGDSKFYWRALHPAYLSVYQTMCRELEVLIGDHFEDINLDNKFEYLVCCRMAGVTSTLEQRIFDEARQSLSSDGHYLIDTLNGNPQIDNISLDKSEHRNVLFIMANRPFTPLT